MPAHVQIPELRAVFALWRGRLIRRTRILGQALFNQLDQRLGQALSVRVRLLQRRVRPLHVDQLRRALAMLLEASAMMSAYGT